MRKTFSSSWFALLVRTGYVIRGILYSIVGLTGVLFALGLRNATAGTSDVITLISNIPYSNILLIIFIIGLGGYSLWGVARACAPDIAIPNRIGYLVSFISYLLLMYYAFQIFCNHAYTQSGMNDVAVKILAVRYGNALLMGIGGFVIISAIFMITKALRADEPEDFGSSAKLEYKKGLYRTFMISARIGVLFRSILFMAIGVFICIAGYRYNSHEVKALNEVLTSLKELRYGPLYTIILSGGLILFGIYSLILSFFVNLLPIQYYE